MQFEKPTETNETRKSELLAEISEWQRSRPRQSAMPEVLNAKAHGLHKSRAATRTQLT